MNPPPAEIGSPVAEVETPALMIDLDALDRNIAKMAEFARA
jgi:D-serine deaminase-like pyridoxal phosphate-dependent protein